MWGIMKNKLVAPIYNAVMDYADKIQRFHTPGHCGKAFDNALFECAAFDITELDFSDNLQCPSGIIADAENLCAAKYGSKKCLFFAAGATQAVHTALFAARMLCDTVYVLGEAHKSVYSGARLASLKVETFIQPTELLTALKKRPAAVLLTMPDYYGLRRFSEHIEDIKTLAKLLIVDESHGAHFIYSDLFPHSLAAYADLCISSFHKTLPVLTGGAALHVNDESLISSCVFYRAELISTSPSYLVLAAIDYARAYMDRDGEKLYKKLFVQVNKCKKAIKKAGFAIFENDDFSRLVVKCNAKKVDEYLRKKGCFAEAAVGDKLIFIVTPFNGDCLKGLASALKLMPKKLKAELKTAQLEVLSEPKTSDFRGKVCYVQPDEALGRLLANEITLYPPGTPIAFEGSRVSAATIHFIRAYKGNIIGLTEGKLAVYEEEL